MLQLVLLAGPMLSMIDSSVVNVAVPVIVTDLHTTLATAAWALSGYLLGLACGLAASPWLARRFGTLPAYQAALAGFVLASAACAVVPSVGLLIAARVVQGLLGAPMVPLAMGLLLGQDGAARTMPPSAGIMLFAAPALGPALGGLLIGAFGWRSVFLINVPVGLAALAGLRRYRRARGGPGGDPAARLDLPGLVLLSAGLGLATLRRQPGPQPRLAVRRVGPGLAGRAGPDRRLPALVPGPAGPGPRHQPRGQPERARRTAPCAHPGSGLRGQRGAVLRAVPGPGLPAGHPAPHGRPAPAWPCCRKAWSWAWPAGWAAC